MFIDKAAIDCMHWFALQALCASPISRAMLSTCALRDFSYLSLPYNFTKYQKVIPTRAIFRCDTLVIF